MRARVQAQTGAWDWTVLSSRGSTTGGPVGGSLGGSHGVNVVVVVVDGYGRGGRGCGRRGVIQPQSTGTSLVLDGRCCLERNGSCDGGGGCIVTATVTESGYGDGDENLSLSHGLMI